MKFIKYPPLLLFFALFLCPPLLKVSAQTGLQHYENFFKFQMVQYQDWLTSNGLSNFFKTDSLSIAPDKLTLHLTYTGSHDCDTAQAIWEQLCDRFSHELLHQKLLEAWSVLAELPTDSMEITFGCQDPEKFKVRIYGDKDGRIALDEHTTDVLGSGTIEIPFDQLKYTPTCQFHDASRKHTVKQIRIAITDYLKKWYHGKGTPRLYNVRIDTTFTTFNELTWEIDQLSHEVLKDEGYFEYHRIKVKVLDRNNRIEINWQFTSKYGSGIIFMPRRNDYKYMETYYPVLEKDYEEKLFALITDFLLKQP